MLTKKFEKSSDIFQCIQCDYQSSRKSQFDRHLLTSKHHKLTSVNTQLTKKFQNDKNEHFTCDKCNKEYKSRVGIWKHNKLCNINNNETGVPNHKDKDNDKDIIMMLIKDNNEFKNLLMEQQTLMMEVVKNGTNNNTTINSHNKTFNLQVFLNETCKDAMNIMEFVDSIKLQLSDFERVGEVGFVNGISDIIIKNLKQLDITERPIHCTDKKRAIMYVKDDDKWEKEDDTNKKVRRAIKYIANKNIKLMDAYKAVHPDCQKSESKYSDSYNKFVIEALGGSGNEDCDNEDKIISRLSKVVTIEK